MKSRSAPGSSTPTWRATSAFRALPLWGRFGAAAALVTLSTVYVVGAFTAPDPLVRIVLRCLPLLPVAVWTLWFDRARPLERRRPFVRIAGRLALLVLVMAFAVLLLGLGLNWLYDPSRVV